MLGWRTDKLQFLVRAGVGWKRGDVPPIQLRDLGSWDPAFLEPCLVAYTQLSTRAVGAGAE